LDRRRSSQETYYYEESAKRSRRLKGGGQNPDKRLRARVRDRTKEVKPAKITRTPIRGAGLCAASSDSADAEVVKREKGEPLEALH